MMPSATDIEYFVEVASTRNLSRAAERIGISQPSLSLAMQRLEETLKTELLIRSRSGVQLTQSGERLLAHSRTLLDQWQLISDDTKRSQDGINGTLTIGCHTSVAMYSLQKFLPRVLLENKEVQFRLAHDLSRNITESVISMRVDIGIVVNPVRHPELIIKPLCKDRVTLFTSTKATPLQDPYSGDGVLLCDPSLLQTQDLVQKLKRKKISYKRLLSSSNLEVIASLVGQGAGFGILPTKVAVQFPLLVGIPDTPFFEDEICVVYRQENRSSRAIQLLSKAIVQGFA